MLEGIAKFGDTPDYLPESRFDGLTDSFSKYAAHVFYGLEGNLPKIFEHAIALSRAVYIDLGYWGRREGGRYEGYHKISVNARHPVGYFRSPQHTGERLERLGVRVVPWDDRPVHMLKRMGHVLVAGMGAKGAAAEGYRPQEWERWAIEELRRYTSREIVYRPKPSDPLGSPIPGTRFSPKTRAIEDEFRDCWAVVTHHSNVAVEALLAGIPCFCWGGVARSMSLQDLSRIENPYIPPDSYRATWARDIAWTQWSVPEMKRGDAWAYLRSEQLV